MSLTISQHPLGRVALTLLRNKDTLPGEVYQRELHRLSLVLAVDTLRYLSTTPMDVETPLATTTGYRLMGQQALVPIMRAGSGMLPAFLNFLPSAIIWHMFMSRNEETLLPEFHGSKVPKHIPASIQNVFILDPMLATGGSACYAIKVLKNSGAKNIVFVGVLGAPEGADKLQREHPDVPIIIGAMDDRLNEHGYIVPGLGDAGDRLFPTV